MHSDNRARNRLRRTPSSGPGSNNGMNKFFPQALKNEEGVQALRGELNAAEAKSSGQCSELAQADRQIRDLHSHLAQLEREQLELNHEMGQSELESADLRESLRTASEERDELKGMLIQSEQEQVEGQHMLDTISEIVGREKRWVEERGAAISRRSAELTRALAETDETQNSISELAEEEERLRMELESAAEFEAYQCEELNVARYNFSKQHSRAMETSQKIRDLRDRMASLEKAGQEARANLSHAELTEQGNRANRQQLSMLDREKKSLMQRIEEVESDSAELEGRVHRFSDESRSAQVMMGRTQQEHEITEAELAVELAMEKDRGSELSETEGERKQLQNDLHQAEEDAEIREQGLQWELLERRKVHEDIRQRVEETDAQSRQVLETHSVCQDECQELEMQVEQLEKEAKDLRVSSEQLEIRSEMMQNKGCRVA